MQRLSLLVLGMILFAPYLLLSQKIEVTGSQVSDIEYRLEQDIALFPDLKELVISFVVPTDFKSPTYQQNLSNLKFDIQPAPHRQEQTRDSRGNLIRTYYWDQHPQQKVKAAVYFRARNRVSLEPLQADRTPFPITNLPARAQVFLSATEQVQVDHPQIQARAKELVADAGTAYEAAQNILFWVVEHMQYVLVPKQYDALYAFKSGKGNCQNYSHLAAALMRAVGIPVRIVNGVTLDRPYDLGVGDGEYQFEMARGRHSWIEVYFSDSGWIPFDAQQSEFFVSNRYVRIEVGVDNNETVNDGLVRWRQSRGSKAQSPQLEEAFDAKFFSDNIDLKGKFLSADLSKVLLSPPMLSVSAVPIAAAEQPEEEVEEEDIITKKEEPEPEPKEKPAEVAEPTPAEEEREPAPKEKEIDYTQLDYTEPFIAGNLEFPEGVDFAFPRTRTAADNQSSYQLQRSFLVETAEYVTSKRQFAQTFVLKKPIKLEQIGLALHNFGGSGRLWLELSEDAAGKPGPTAVISKKVPTQYIRTKRGYDWVDFDFSDKGIVLSPGRYWFYLHYSGSPIVNWFYSYGKPVGPIDGTRSRLIGQQNWPKILSFEFNYRVKGKAATEGKR